MVHKLPSLHPGYVRLIFTLPASLWASEVYLVGEFNHWQPTATPFVQTRDGVWRAVVEVVAGRSYQFRYLVDEMWQTDYQADSWVVDGLDTLNSVVHASLPAPSPAQSSSRGVRRTAQAVTPSPSYAPALATTAG